MERNGMASADPMEIGLMIWVEDGAQLLKQLNAFGLRAGQLACR